MPCSGFSLAADSTGERRIEHVRGAIREPDG
jgi:hypothetical protein